MQNTNVITTSPNIEGNIGSCEVKETSFSTDSWHTTTVATNSCTGEIITQNNYFNWGIVYFPVIIFLMVAGIKYLFD